MDIKRVFVFLMVGIFMLSMASAFDFDNVKHYNPVTREATIKNCNLWVGVCLIKGDTIGKARLNTPLNMKVALGYQKVAEFEITSYQDYNDILKQFTFKDMKTDKTISREIDIKYKSYATENVDDYETICSTPKDAKININGTSSLVCEQVIIGSHEETKEVWTLKPTTNLLKDEKIIIGLFTEVEVGDYVDWIPTIYGVEVGEWASWTASLNVNLLSYYKMDGGVTDELGNHDGSDSGTINATGKINASRSFDGTNDYVQTNSFTEETTGSVNFWVKTTDNTNDIWIQTDNTGNENRGALQWNAGQIVIYDKTTSGGSAAIFADATSSAPLINGSWHMLTLTFTSTANTTKIYIDGVAATMSRSDASTANPIISGLFTFGKRIDNYGYFDGDIDEVGIWSRELTQTDITQLYNNFDGITYTTFSDTAPNITLNSPTVNANYTTHQSLVINFTAYDDTELTDVKLYVDSVLNQTNASGINDTVYLFDLDLSDGEHTIYGKATDNSSQETDSESIQINIDTTPFIEFLTPPTLIDYANITQEYIPMKVNVSTPYFYNLTYYLENVNDTAYTQYFENETYDINFTDMPDAHYHYNVTICTTTTQCNSTETRHINHDATSPTIINALNLSDQTTFSLPINSTWNYTASDPHIDSCYYNTTDHAIEVITCNASIGTEWTTGGNKTVRYCANDTFGNEGCLTDYVLISYITETQAESQDPTVEGLTVTWNLTINLSNIPTTTALIVINDTLTYSPTTTTAGTDGYFFEFVKDIPDNWGNTTGNTLDWYWNYTIDGVVTNESTDTDNITVYELAIDNCSTYGDVILDLSLYDEELGSLINESAGVNVEIDLILTSQANSSISLTYNHTWVNESNPQVCIPYNVLNDTQYTINFTIGFDSTGRVWEFFYMDGGTLNSTKIFDTQTDSTITLMDLLTADSTSFLFNYFDEDGLAVDGSIVHVMRKYIGSGVFLEVERGKADQNGDTTIHLVEEDVIYYFIVTKDGDVLHTSSTYTALCQVTPCTLQIEASSGSAVFDENWDLIDDGAYTISSSSATRDASLDYSTTGISTWNFTVYKYESDGSYTALNTSSSTGTAGTITLNVPQSAGNVSFFATAHQDENFINSEWINFEGKAQTYFGSILSLFMASLIILSLGLMSVSRGGITIFWIMLGVLTSSFLGLMTTALSTGVSVVVYLCLAGGIILWKLTRRRT